MTPLIIWEDMGVINIIASGICVRSEVSCKNLSIDKNGTLKCAN